MGVFILKNILTIAMVIIGSIIGAGFASGQEINSFFYKYGIIGILGIIISIILIILIIYKVFLNYKEKIINKYLVKIIYQKKEYLLEGFIDTGNRLVSPIKKESIILVNLKIPLKKVIYVPYKALNTSGIIPCIRPDKILINNKEITNCLIGIANEKFALKDIDCILPNKLKEELC